MSVTIRQIASSAEIQLQQMYDDAKIPFSLLCFWATIFANKARQLDLQGKLQGGKDVNAEVDGWVEPGADLSIFPEIPVYTATANVTDVDSPGMNVTKGLKYIILPAAIDEDKDNRAISYISYKSDIDNNYPGPAHNTFYLTSRNKLRRAMMSAYERPSAKHPYAARVGNLIHLFGIERINVKYVEIALRLQIGGGIDDPLPLDNYVDIILEQILKMGMVAIQTAEELTNDGSGQKRGSQRAQQVNLDQAFDSGGAQQSQGVE